MNTHEPNTNRLNRLRYGLYVPFYDIVARHLDRGRQRSIELLDLPSASFDVVLLPLILAVVPIHMLRSERRAAY